MQPRTTDRWLAVAGFLFVFSVGCLAAIAALETWWPVWSAALGRE